MHSRRCLSSGLYAPCCLFVSFAEATLVDLRAQLIAAELRIRELNQTAAQTGSEAQSLRLKYQVRWSQRNVFFRVVISTADLDVRCDIVSPVESSAFAKSNCCIACQVGDCMLGPPIRVKRCRYVDFILTIPC